MKHYFFFLLIIVVCLQANAQQLFQASQYMFTSMSYNPAYAGSQDQIELDALVRQQWWGFPGAPITSSFNVNAPVKPFRTQGGVGLSIVNDKFAITNQLSMAATYAYRINIGKGKLGIGARLGFANHAAAYSKLSAKDAEFIPPTDDRGFAFPDVDLGLYYNEEKTYFGLSAVHLTSPVIKYRTGGSQDFTLNRVLCATAGYRHQFENPLFEILPSFFILSDLNVTYMDFSSLLFYNKKVWGGLTYRSGNGIFGNAVVLLLGIEMKNGIKFGYSYDFGLSDIGKYKNNIGSHEITLRYGLKISKDKIPQKYKSIRFL